MAKKVQMLEMTCQACGTTFVRPPCAATYGALKHCNRQCRRDAMRPEHQLRTRVDRSGGSEGCWPWTGRRDRDGYGFLYFDRQRFRAHRVAWEIANDAIVPSELVMRHRCPGGGNPWCCNPKHLVPGTVADNNADTVRDGRKARGERSGKSSLIATQVIEIRQRWTLGESRAVLARDYGVTTSSIAHIVKGRVWKHIAVEPVASRAHLDVEAVS
jgi:hypothetical protein